MKVINKITSALLVLGLGITVVSCKKETPTPTPAPTKTELLTGGNWMLTSYVVDNVEIYDQIQSCQQDNLNIFNANNTVTIDEGPTKCDPLDPQMKSMFFRFSQIDSLNFLEVSKWYSSIISVNKSDKFLLKLDNGQLIELESMKYNIATPYSGKWHINIDYFLSKENLKFLQNNLITEVRIYTTDGYIEESVNSKNSIKIKSSSNCIK